MKTRMFICAMLCMTASLSAQVTDIDGNTYKTVIIGDQEWMAENLRVKSFRNGEPVANIRNNLEWYHLKTPSWSYYDHEWKNGQTCGLLYNGYAVNDSRGLCPEGWHVPSVTEWEKMFEVFGGIEKVGKAIKPIDVFSTWSGNNHSGFTALPGGQRLDLGAFLFEGLQAYWWASGASVLYYLCITGDRISKLSSDFNAGLSVRCVRSN